MEDQEIYDLYWNRSESAITETHKKYGAWCGGIAMRILQRREDAEECVNDTYLRVWNNIPPQRPKVFRAWLGRITRNLALSRFRSLTAEKRGGGQTVLALEELRDCVSGREDMDAAMDSMQIVTAINRFLKSLPDKQRWIFMRRYWQLSSVADIAAACGAKESQITSSLLRSRKKLREMLEKEGIAL